MNPVSRSMAFGTLKLQGSTMSLPFEDVKGIVLKLYREPDQPFRDLQQNTLISFITIFCGVRGETFLSVPHRLAGRRRDERMGWMGDAQLFARAATYNMNVDQFFKRWLYSVRDNQGRDGNYPGTAPDLGRSPIRFGIRFWFNCMVGCRYYHPLADVPAVWR